MKRAIKKAKRSVFFLEKGRVTRTTLLKHLIRIAKEKFRCYKIILDCAEKNEKFYEKCGFVKKEIQMALYL